MDQEKPLISVIIPTFNCGHYILQAIESVFLQDYPRYELIVIDDGSTDETRQILEPYISRIRYVYQENSGLPAALNHGIRLAEGELINFLDADDMFLPGKLTAQEALFAQESSMGAVHSGWQNVNHDGEIITRATPWLQAPCLNLETWLKLKPIYPCALLFRKTWLTDIGGFDTSLPQANDLDIVIRLALAGCRFAWLPRITISYRQHQGNITRKGLQQVECVEHVLDKAFHHPRLPSHIRGMEREIRFFTLLSCAWHLYRTHEYHAFNLYLNKTRLLSGNVSRTDLVLLWSTHFLDRGLAEGYCPDQLVAALPCFRKAAGIPEHEWQTLETILRTSILIWFQGHPDSRDFKNMRLWQDLRHLSPCTVAAYLQKMIVFSISPPAEEQTLDIWNTICKNTRFTGPCRHENVTLSLAFAAKAALNQEWRQTVLGVLRALRIIRSAEAIRALIRFSMLTMRHLTQTEGRHRD